MSTTIFYKRLFIRLPDGSFIPLILSGDSNCYMPSGKRMIRSRSWHVPVFGNNGPKLSYTAEEIREDTLRRFRSALSNAENNFSSHEDPSRKGTPLRDARERFGYYDCCALHGKSFSTTTFNDYRSFLEKGMEHAIDVKDYFRICGALMLRFDGGKTLSFTDSDSMGKAYREHLSRTGLHPDMVPADTSLLDILADAVDAHRQRGEVLTITRHSADGTTETRYIRSLIPFRTAATREQVGRFSARWLGKTDINAIVNVLAG